MEKENIENLESMNIGMVGHVEHGKTTLLYKLTGKLTITHSEELKRGMTIKLGYADFILREKDGKFNTKEGKPLRYVSFVDVPGHEMLMATMLSGAALIDAAILVIAANEGIKPQTREHLVALQARNIKQIIIVQNKIDLVSKEQALKNYQQIKEFVKGTIAENAPIIPCSAQQEINIDKIIEAIYNLKVPQRDTASPPLFVIARSFDINRPGTKIESLKGGVLGGALKKGKLKIGDEIEIKPGLVLKKENQTVYKSVRTKIVSLHKGTFPVQAASPGGSIAIETELDPILTKADNLSGCVAGISGTVPEITNKIKVRFKLFDKLFGAKEDIKVENIKSAEFLLLSINTSITVGLVTRVAGNTAEFNLKIPVVPFKQDTMGIGRNINGHWRLIGWGELI
jgi:translation initiation factor 2 subunit 3